MAIRVFLMDDHEVVRRGLSDLITSAPGIEVVGEAGTCAEGLQGILVKRPDVAVLDYNLGKGPNGIDLANQLRKIQPHIAIVLLTAFLDPAQLDKRVAELPAGSRYLIKHSVTKIEVLIEEIKEALKSAPTT